MVVDTDAGLESRLQADGVPHIIADPSEESVSRQVGVERPGSGLRRRLGRGQRLHHADRTCAQPRLTIVARASRRQSLQALEKAGADHVISPYKLSGNRMAALSLRPSLVDFIEMVTVGPDLRLDEIVVQDGSPLVGTTVDGACASYRA